MNCPRCGGLYSCSCSDWQVRQYAEEQEPFIQFETPIHEACEEYIEERENN